MIVVKYVSNMKALGDEMAAADKCLEDAELVEYILTGIRFIFNPIVSALVARKDTISVSELHSQLLAFETRMELMTGDSDSSSANMANRGG